MQWKDDFYYWFLSLCTFKGWDNCTHDYILVSPSGDTTFSDGEKYCGGESPVLLSSGNRLTIKFKSDDLFRKSSNSTFLNFHILRDISICNLPNLRDIPTCTLLSTEIFLLSPSYYSYNCTLPKCSNIPTCTLPNLR